ncbi:MULTISPECIES: DUF2285 domain-containing protein [unclassified Aureimonas]|uniref:DUF2285 domain-containing protein n=1 Tax=unclassified Aureimonas TaxID=2615206 RepID=UPI0006F4703F|nr:MULTISPECIES: DUF2285 domain-containing protein [unclassified Aureimonas]KQT62094.1 hypothetical protein ASG62_23435 [Aureimonas sp. Leaf427]KQT72366.1 hypothetical protein ASG54_18615 [Aureimonas sp. Leaf460]
MTVEDFSDDPPQGEHLTGYDREHVRLYCRLLDSVADGADWREAVAVLFGIDPDTQSERALQVYHAHLARARWMTHTGYKHLLAGRIH